MEPQSALTRLITIAAEQNSLAGIREMLRGITQAMSSWGTLVWAPSASSDLDEGQGRLFVLAFWTSDPEARVWHEISFQSMTGQVLQSGIARQNRVGDDGSYKPTPRLITESGAQRFALAPMRMADGTGAVLEVYRLEDQPFSADEMRLLSEMAAVLPVLYANLTSRVGRQLLDDVMALCLQSDGKQVSHADAMGQIVKCVATAFAGLETSLFLRSLDDEPDLFPMVANDKVWDGPWTGRTAYNPGQGATGYVLETGKTVMLDFNHYEHDVEWIRTQYPGLAWDDSLRIRDRARDYFKTTDPESSPPLSFICSPVKSRGSILGAIRCSGSITCPYYFDQWQSRYLEVLGERLGSWWNNILTEERLNREIDAWQSLMRGFDGMNGYVQKHLNKQSWNEEEFFREAMRVAVMVIPNTENSDVLLREDNELVTSATYGLDWDRYPAAAKGRYRVNPPECTASDLVSQDEKSVWIFEKAEQAPHQNLIFAGTRKLVLAKIEAGDQVYGVLRIRSKSARPFSPNVELIAGLVGQQLGLYHSLSQQILKLQDAESTNRKLIETQAKELGDVHHQVKSPIINAHRAARRLISNPLLPRILRPDGERIRGLCGKVSRVVRNMGMFADLAADKPVRLARAVLTREALLRILQESCGDHQALVDAERRLRFELREKSFEELAGRNRIGKLVEGDAALIEQCVNNLVDNAAKYSYDGTTILVSGGTQAKGTQFFVSVVNDGFEVKPEEASKLKRRGYRSDMAIAVTGEGSGIGLWIVDEVMRAHGGRLAITPTQNKRTEFRLVFPIIEGVDKLTYEPQSALARG